MLNHNGVDSDPLTELSRDARVWATEIASGANQIIRGAPTLTAELIATEVARTGETLAARAWKIRNTIGAGSHEHP
jgi:hypothetical protein